ncbi:hypothetical protein [Teredinibacter turnerae]|uniref:hypothetical protein n=1 Tax=Teredinibacter turnerae TaxID=2426 RepID=UPI0030CF42B7
MQKKRTLSPMLDELKAKKVFSDQESKVLEAAKQARNDFTHRLSEPYTSSIKSGSSMLELIRHFLKIKENIQVATRMAESKMHDIANTKGLDVNFILQSAKEYAGNCS